MEQAWYRLVQAWHRVHIAEGAHSTKVYSVLGNSVLGKSLTVSVHSAHHHIAHHHSARLGTLIVATFYLASTLRGRVACRVSQSSSTASTLRDKRDAKCLRARTTPACESGRRTHVTRRTSHITQHTQQASHPRHSAVALFGPLGEQLRFLNCESLRSGDGEAGCLASPEMSAGHGQWNSCADLWRRLLLLVASHWSPSIALL